MSRRHVLYALLCACFLLAGLLGESRQAFAATVTVTSLADSGTCPSPTTCTLRGALDAAAPGDSITFDVAGTIYVSTQLVISKDVTIQGPGASVLALDGQGTSGLLRMPFANTVHVSGLTLKNGARNEGAAIFSNNTSTITVTDCVIVDNVAVTYGGAIELLAGQITVTNSTIARNTAATGGGIAVLDAQVSVIGSTITENTATSGSGVGGGIFGFSSPISVDTSIISNNTAPVGGAVFVNESSLTMTRSSIFSNTGTTHVGGIHGTNSALTISNTTISGNSTPGSGGGLAIDSGSLTLTNGTVANNQATASGGGIIRTGGTAQLRNSIVANNPTGGNCAGTFSSLGNNLSDTTACFTANPAIGDVIGNPLLRALALNAPGMTPTHALSTGSPATDGVTYNPSDCPATDQRGVTRPQIIHAQRCDIGAFELGGNTAPRSSSIADLSTPEDTATDAILFSIEDDESAGSFLTVTATSSNTALIPNSGIKLGGSGATRSLVLTPAANQSGTAVIDVTVSDGSLSTHETFTLTVLPVNDAPTAANDSYTVAALQTLTVPNAGVLINDTDPEGTVLSAQLVTGPAQGRLTLNPAGGFTYTPSPSFSGTDTFTYRASDGGAQSSPATVTITVTASTCAPRANVKVDTAIVNGKLEATVIAQPLSNQTNNRLVSIQFGQFQNGTVTLNGQPITSNQTYTAPTNTTQTTFVVTRTTPGQATQILLTVTDACGSWQTFVGGGASAGF